MGPEKINPKRRKKEYNFIIQIKKHVFENNFKRNMNTYLENKLTS